VKIATQYPEETMKGTSTAAASVARPIARPAPRGSVGFQPEISARTRAARLTDGRGGVEGVALR
jgi:hypothetical protein